MLEDVTKRLASYGYAVVEADAWVLTFIISKVENHIKNQCNTTLIPTGLHEIAVDMAVGEFMFGKKSMGQLTGFSLDAAIKSIQEGDSNVTFSGVQSSEERLNTLISYLMHGDMDFSTYRRIKW